MRRRTGSMATMRCPQKREGNRGDVARHWRNVERAFSGMLERRFMTERTAFRREELDWREFVQCCQPRDQRRETRKLAVAGWSPAGMSDSRREYTQGLSMAERAKLSWRNWRHSRQLAASIHLEGDSRGRSIDVSRYINTYGTIVP